MRVRIGQGHDQVGNEAPFDCLLGVAAAPQTLVATVAYYTPLTNLPNQTQQSYKHLLTTKSTTSMKPKARTICCLITSVRTTLSRASTGSCKKRIAVTMTKIMELSLWHLGATKLTVGAMYKQ